MHNFSARIFCPAAQSLPFVKDKVVTPLYVNDDCTPKLTLSTPPVPTVNVMGTPANTVILFKYGKSVNKLLLQSNRFRVELNCGNFVSLLKEQSKYAKELYLLLHQKDLILYKIMYKII